MNRKRLILSTGNIHKVEEIRDILKDLPIDILSKDNLKLKGFIIEEDGKTLKENAIKKAIAIAEKVEGMVIADDSGLFVDVLDGAPGILSVRYSGVSSTDEKNNIKLLNQLKGFPIEKRGATFKTVIALILEDKSIITVTGECKGKIGLEIKGHEGFGYDPLFVVEGYNKTFAELGQGIKNKISHRAKALEKLKEEIIRIFEDDVDENNCSK